MFYLFLINTPTHLGDKPLSSKLNFDSLFMNTITVYFSLNTYGFQKQNTGEMINR